MHPSLGYRVRAEIASPSGSLTGGLSTMRFDRSSEMRWLPTEEPSRDLNNNSGPEKPRRLAEDFDRDIRILRAWLGPRAGRYQ